MFKLAIMINQNFQCYHYVASVSEEKAALCINDIVYDVYFVNINYIILRYYVYCEVFVYLFAKGLFRFSLPDFILVKNKDFH